MTDNFFDKTLTVRNIEEIPGLLEFDIPVHGDNRGWFKENFQKEKMLPLGFPESFLQKENCKTMYPSHVKCSPWPPTQNLGISTSL